MLLLAMISQNVMNFADECTIETGFFFFFFFFKHLQSEPD